MNKFLALTFFLLIGLQANAAKVTCHRTDFSGLEKTKVRQLGEVITYEVFIDSEGYEMMKIETETGEQHILDYAGEHGRYYAIGATYLANAYWGHSYPNLGLRSNLRIEVGEGRHAGTLKASRDAYCWGGYRSGCSGMSRANYKCQ